MYEIYKFFNSWLWYIPILISFICCVSSLWTEIRTKGEDKNIFYLEPLISLFSDKKYTVYLYRFLNVVLSVFILLALLFSNGYFLTEILKSEDLRLMPDGRYCYYVEATNEKGKTYILPAQINKTEGDYFVDYIYFDNGGYLYFDWDEYAETFTDTIEDEDQDGHKWRITLTNKKTSHYKVEEVKEKDYFNLFFYWFATLVHIIGLVRQLLHIADDPNLENNNNI